MPTIVSLSGGGTPTGDTVADMIEAAWEAANDAQRDASNFASNAVAASRSNTAFDHIKLDLEPDYDSTDIDTRAEEKLATLDADVNKVLNTTVPNNYDKLYKQLVGGGDGNTSIFEGEWDAADAIKIVSTISKTFNDTYMFGGESLDQSLGSLSDTILTSILGTSSDLPFGLPARVEDGLRNRVNDASTREVFRAEEEAIAIFAARGFPAPPGMLNRIGVEAQQKAISSRAETNREVFIDQAKRGFEASKLYIDTFRDIQKQGQQAFVDYLNICLQAKKDSTADINSLIDAIVKLRGSVIGLYNYIDKEKAVFLREAIAEYELKYQQERIDLDHFRARVDGEINATISAAQSMGQLAAAALGSQNTMATLAEETITEGGAA